MCYVERKNASGRDEGEDELALRPKGQADETTAPQGNALRRRLVVQSRGDCETDNIIPGCGDYRSLDR